MAGYTYGKSLDDSSSLSEPVYPMGADLTKAISAFDLRHNFVASYRYELPFAGIFRAQNRLTTGWSLSGITRFASGLPVTLYNNTDSSLLGTMPNGINNNGVDTPYYTPGNLEIKRNPRNGQPAFNTACSRPSQFLPWPDWEMRRGASSTAPASKTSTWRCRRICRSPKARLWSSAWKASTSSITRSSSEQSAVNGNISSAGFGQIVNAAPPRQVQMAVKLQF